MTSYEEGVKRASVWVGQIVGPLEPWCPVPVALCKASATAPGELLGLRREPA